MHIAMQQYTGMPKPSNVNCRWRQWTKLTASETGIVEGEGDC